MEGARESLSLDDVAHFNRVLIAETGEGSYNPRSRNLLYPNANSLEHVIETLDDRVFGQPKYPHEFDKASALVWAIIGDHAFTDGCKRTGMFTLRVYLRLHGWYPAYERSEAADFAVRIANRVETGISRADVRDWIEENFVRELDLEITPARQAESRSN